MIINLSGTSFVDYEMLKQYRVRLDANQQIECDIVVKQVSPEPPASEYDSDYAVIANGKDMIGWIPQLKTIKKYTGEAFKKNDRKRHDQQLDRFKWAEMIRNNITVDIFRNEVSPKCFIDGIYHLNESKGWGVVVRFNYPI